MKTPLVGARCTRPYGGCCEHKALLEAKTRLELQREGDIDD
jgi:hypothetical protein